MGRWTQYDEDDYRLPEGMKRVGYDADTGQYTYIDTKDDTHWEGATGAQYGTLNRVISSPPPAQARRLYAPSPLAHGASTRSNSESVAGSRRSVSESANQDQYNEHHGSNTEPHGHYPSIRSTAKSLRDSTGPPKMSRTMSMATGSMYSDNRVSSVTTTSPTSDYDNSVPPGFHEENQSFQLSRNISVKTAQASAYSHGTSQAVPAGLERTASQRKGHRKYPSEPFPFLTTELKVESPPHSPSTPSSPIITATAPAISPSKGPAYGTQRPRRKTRGFLATVPPHKAKSPKPHYQLHRSQTSTTALTVNGNGTEKKENDKPSSAEKQQPEPKRRTTRGFLATVPSKPPKHSNHRRARTVDETGARSGVGLDSNPALVPPRPIGHYRTRSHASSTPSPSLFTPGSDLSDGETEGFVKVKKPASFVSEPVNWPDQAMTPPNPPAAQSAPSIKSPSVRKRKMSHLSGALGLLSFHRRAASTSV